MGNRRIIFIFLLFPVSGWTQYDGDAIETAKLGLIEKMYESSAGQFRKQLDGRGWSDEEVEDILFEAIDAYALCSVLAAQAQAHEQGLSEEIVLKGIGHKTRGKEESLILLSLDTDALTLKREPCSKAFGEKLGVIIL